MAIRLTGAEPRIIEDNDTAPRLVTIRDEARPRVSRDVSLQGSSSASTSQPQAARVYLIGKEDKVRQGLITNPKTPTLQQALKGGGVGGGLGSALGSVVPGLGNIVGGAIGTVAGAVGGFFSGIFSKDKKTPLFEVYNEQLYNLLLKANPGIRFKNLNWGGRGLKYFSVEREFPVEGFQALIREFNNEWLSQVPEIPDGDDRRDIREAIPTIRLSKTVPTGYIKMMDFLEAKPVEPPPPEAATTAGSGGSQTKKALTLAGILGAFTFLR